MGCVSARKRFAAKGRGPQFWRVRACGFLAICLALSALVVGRARPGAAAEALARSGQGRAPLQGALVAAESPTGQAAASERSLAESVGHVLHGSPEKRSAQGIGYVEALLASGCSQDAEQAAEQLIELSRDQSDAAAAIKLWALARFRQSKPLSVPGRPSPIEKTTVATAASSPAAFWAKQLGSRQPYRFAAPEVAAVLELHDFGSVAGEVNGVAMPAIFIDSGAQYTLMTREAAQAAGVELGRRDASLVGFASFSAQPGVLRELRFAGLSIGDVPVLVGDSSLLHAAGGQMALGIDFLHHVRLSLDYPAGRVTIASSAARSEQPQIPTEVWQIRLWTFSQACLAEARVPGGGSARVLIDTGNRQGAYVSRRWSRLNRSAFIASRGLAAFSSRSQRGFESLELGDHTLESWPIVGSLPTELERLNLFDILLGHDLLSSYKVTFNLRARTLLLEPSPGSEH